MALVGLVQLTQSILNQTLQDSKNQEANSKNKLAIPSANASETNADTFVPSAQSPAQDAGTFQVQQVSLFSAAANLLLQPTAAAAPAAATPANNVPPANAQNAQTTAANQAAVATAQTAAAQPAATGPTTTTDTATDAAAVQQQLASLNDSLAVLGLSASEINVVDGVAQLIKDFNPAAFGGLINQLQTLAQASAPQTTTATPAANPAAANPATAAATATANPNFSLNSLNIQFAGINETIQAKGHGKNANDNAVNVSAFNLQVSEVTLALNNNNTGQTALVQATQPQTAPAAVPLKAAAAAA